MRATPYVASIVTAFLLASSARPAIRTTYDKFSGETTIGTVPTPPSSSPSLAFVATYTKTREDGLPDPSTVGMMLVVSGSDWRYLNCSATYWLADGKRFELPQPTHDGHVGNGYVLEFLQIKILKPAELRKLAAAQRVEFKICNDEYVVSPSDLADLRVFSEKLNGPDPSFAMKINNEAKGESGAPAVSIDGIEARIGDRVEGELAQKLGPADETIRKPSLGVTIQKWRRAGHVITAQQGRIIAIEQSSQE